MWGVETLDDVISRTRNQRELDLILLDSYRPGAIIRPAKGLFLIILILLVCCSMLGPICACSLYSYFHCIRSAQQWLGVAVKWIIGVGYDFSIFFGDDTSAQLGVVFSHPLTSQPLRIESHRILYLMQNLTFDHTSSLHVVSGRKPSREEAAYILT